MARFGHFPAISLGRSFVGQGIQEKLYDLCIGHFLIIDIKKLPIEDRKVSFILNIVDCRMFFASSIYLFIFYCQSLEAGYNILYVHQVCILVYIYIIYTYTGFAYNGQVEHLPLVMKIQPCNNNLNIHCIFIISPLF